MRVFHFLILATAMPVAAQSTIAPAQASAYAANAGWVNFRPSAADGVVVDEAFLSGYAYAANFGWIHFGDGSPANGYAYANNSATDCGVNHDGQGNLGGYAWSANTGWIHFGWATANDSNRPRIDLLTGEFSGYAWSPNLGWLNLGGGLLKTSSIHYADSDGDGIADAWEFARFGNLNAANATSDADHDGQSDAAEYGFDTLPSDATSRFRILSQSLNAAVNSNQLSWSSSPRRLYRLEYAANLAGPWTQSSLGTIVPDAGASTTRSLAFPTGPRTFFRAVSVRPLSTD
ncbi:hypothetical protein [Haloferula sp. BvORR071]|uniref:hypothetical protein n=1 Tax=Haloferula sp. BvORR071 TaxID=1396141 RepID=UPI002240F501|nr:hypothetical protein [Haloferula sp. BvORR071]